MTVYLAGEKDIQPAAGLDDHIPLTRLSDCIRDGHVYLLSDGPDKNISGDYEKNGSDVIGILRYGLLWQTLPFLELLYIDGKYRGKGYGTAMLRKWECDMLDMGYKYTLTSTMACETAWRFYEKYGYRKTGGFFPPEQDSEEYIYVKELVRHIW